VLNLAEQVPLVIEILTKKHEGSFFETPCIGLYAKRSTVDFV